MYHGLFHSVLSYGLEVWGSTSKVNLEKVFKFQKRTVRAIKKLGYNESCREAFKVLKIPTLFSQHIMGTILALNYGHASELQLNHDSISHSYSTRYKENASINYNIPYHRTTLYEKNTFYRGSLYYNALPNSIKTLGISSNKFKIKLKQLLLSKPLYSFDEYFELCNQV